MKLDYIIVGCGLAGIAFCEQLKTNNKTFIVYDNNSQFSSSVAGGLYNPVVLKRFTPVWRSKEQLDLALPMYSSIEKELEITLDHKIPVYRLFNSAEEQNNWFTASDKINLSNWLSTSIIKNNNPFIDAPFGFGKILNTGRIDSNTLIKAYKEDLRNSDKLLEEAFKYDELKFKENSVKHNEIVANNVVFAEGFGIKTNPYFRDLPLKGTKGELLVINAPGLKIDFVLKSSVFLIPLGENNYIVGSTYNWIDKSNSTTKEARKELLEKLNSFISCEFQVIEQVAGIRPTVIDRRPLVGRHHKFKNLFVLNGLGTRGVIIAPYIAKQLYNHIESDLELESEIDIRRFD